MLIIPESANHRLLQFLIELIQMGKHVEHEHLQYFQTPRLEIEAPEGLQINLDGQPDHGSHFRFELVQDQLAVYLPRALLISRLRIPPMIRNDIKSADGSVPDSPPGVAGSSGLP